MAIYTPYQKTSSSNHDTKKLQIPKFDVSQLNQTNYVDKADKIIQVHNKEDKKEQITSNQIRNLLELVNEIYEILRLERASILSDELVGRIQYVKMRFVYAAGRDKGVKRFMDRSGLIDCLDSVGNDAEQFRLVCKYMEALVAYHKYYINK